MGEGGYLNPTFCQHQEFSVQYFPPTPGFRFKGGGGFESTLDSKSPCTVAGKWSDSNTPPPYLNPAQICLAILNAAGLQRPWSLVVSWGGWVIPEAGARNLSFETFDQKKFSLAPLCASVGRLTPSHVT